jgi:hypothetical protein
MSEPVEIVLIIAAVAYVLVRRLAGEPAQANRLLVLPGVLAVIGLTDLKDITLTGASVAFLVATVAAGALLGVLRGASVRLSERDGIAFVRYTWLTIVLWAVNLAVKFGANILLGIVDPHAGATAGDSLLLTLGIGMLCEGGVVLLRVLRTDSRIVRAQREAGQQLRVSQLTDRTSPLRRRRSPLLDGRRDRLHDRRG